MASLPTKTLSESKENETKKPKLDSESTMPQQEQSGAPRIVSKEEWLKARLELLEQEKALTKMRDELSRKRQAMPWVKIDKDYVFTVTGGVKVSLADLFGDCSQLVVYHFMYPKEWDEPCSSCSFWADSYNGTQMHLKARDVALVAVSISPIDKLDIFKKRMGWNFRWVSSADTDFNRDFNVSFTPQEIEAGEVYYNYHKTRFPVTEAQGISVFCKKDGVVYHSYSCYARGLDMMNGAYHTLDLVPKGRDEDNLPYTMSWLRLHDSYDSK